MNMKQLKRSGELVTLLNDLIREPHMDVDVKVKDYSRGSANCSHRERLLSIERDGINLIKEFYKSSTAHVIDDVVKELSSYGVVIGNVKIGE